MADKIFIAWRALAGRTKRLAKLLNIKLLFIRDKPPYIIATLKTIISLLKTKPKSILIQLPQGPLLLTVSIFKKLLKYRLVADLHTAFLFHTRLKEKVLNKPFIPCLRTCDLVLVHNSEIKKNFIKDKIVNKKTVVLHDPLPEFPIEKEIKKRANIFCEVQQSKEIYPEIYTTGEIEGSLPTGKIRTSIKEQSLIISTVKGLIVVTGCAHSGISNILNSADKLGKVYALIGGFHDFEGYNLLKDISLIVPTHCTVNKKKIMSLFPNNCLKGGVGFQVDFQD